MKLINWGFIGCGDVVERKSGPAFTMVEGSKVVAVMSPGGRRARHYANAHDIPRWYDDASQLINDPDVNAVYVATPPSSHATYAIMAMKAGKAVYVEKPMAGGYDDCARVNYVQQKTGVPCFVAFYRRYLPYFLRVKQLIDDGVIGKVLNVQVRFAAAPQPLDYSRRDELPWRLQPAISGGGLFYDLAPHHIDLLQHLFGIIIEARGICANRGGLYPVEDTVSAVFQFENGIPGSASWSFVAHESALSDRVLVMGREGSLSFSVFNYSPIVVHTTAGEQRIEEATPDIVEYPLIKRVVEHLQGLGQCNCTCETAMPTNWVLDRILGKI